MLLIYRASVICLIHGKNYNRLNNKNSMYANKVKKIAAVHDLSGMGRVSLTVVIPILSSMGFQVCPLPTAVLSNHTQYPGFSFLDLTDEMPKIIAEWKKLEVQFDAIYTGYLGSPRQIQIVSDFIKDFR